MKTITRLGACILLSFVCAPSKQLSAETDAKLESSAQNKNQARKIHELTSRIYSGDLDPKQMIDDLTSLETLLAESPFAKVAGMDEFQVVARAVYSWRTTDYRGTKSQHSERRNSNETEVGGRTAVLGPLVDVDAKYRRLINELKSKSASESTEIQSDGHKIEDLREAWHQSYRLLLNSLGKLGFPAPVNEKNLVGTWAWTDPRTGEEILLTFEDDHSLVATADPLRLPDGFYLDGKYLSKAGGSWAIDYNQLSVRVEEKSAWINNKTILSVSADMIVLEGPKDNVLKRKSIPSASSRKKNK